MAGTLYSGSYCDPANWRAAAAWARADLRRRELEANPPSYVPHPKPEPLPIRTPRRVDLRKPRDRGPVYREIDL